jgi:monoterpene epsilon-lactone hydrolase
VVSTQARCRNMAARLLKPVINSDYDPVQMRRRLARQTRRPQDDAFELHSVGAAIVEERTSGRGHGQLLYVAGGGWFFPPTQQHRAMVDELAAKLGVTGYLACHRLAPEDPFPSAYDDVMAAVAWLRRRAPHEPLVLMGDSSGGALALSAAYTATLEFRATCVVGISPATDLELASPSLRANNRRDPVGGRKAIVHKRKHYLQAGDPLDPRASPLYADLREAPPTLLIASESEVLRDDSVRMRDRLLEAGIPAQLVLERGVPHVFPLASALPEAQRARQAIVQFVAGHLDAHRLSVTDGQDSA